MWDISLDVAVLIVVLSCKNGLAYVTGRCNAGAMLRLMCNVSVN